MSLRTSRIILALFLAALMGTVGVVLIPDLLKLAGPVVCPGGETTVGEHGFQAGTAGGVEFTLTCAPPSGEPYNVPVPLIALVSTIEALVPALIIAFLLPPVIYRPFMSKDSSE